MVTYDPRGMTWDQYCNLMQELFSISPFGSVDESHWQDFGIRMIANGYFANSAIPDPRAYPTWQNWAEALRGILSLSKKMSI